MTEGDAFIPAKFDCHLWIVLSDPSVDPEKVVIVNFTTHTVDEERHCVITQDEHPFVKHKTSVRFWDGKVVKESELKALVTAGQLRPNAPLSAALLKKVRDGAGKSEFLPTECRRVLEEQGLA